MKKLILLLSFILCMGVGTAYSQYYGGGNNSGSGFDPSRLTYGGSFSMQFGDYTAIGLSPQIGYNFSKYMNAGAGFGYNYFREKEYDYKWSRHYLSFNIYGQFYPVDFLVISVQPEMSRMWETVEYRSMEEKYEKFVPSVVIGGGLRYMGMTAMIKYDLVQDDYSPYGRNIFYSVGFYF